MPVMYWVVGGRYRTTQFDQPEGQEEWAGPFKDYEAAVAEWQRRAWATVDDALSRYRIERMAAGQRPPAS